MEEVREIKGLVELAKRDSQSLGDVVYIPWLDKDNKSYSESNKKKARKSKKE